MAGPALIPLLLGGAALGSLYDSYGDKIAKTAREIKNRKKDKPKINDSFFLNTKPPYYSNRTCLNA